DGHVTGVQTCALPICAQPGSRAADFASLPEQCALRSVFLLSLRCVRLQFGFAARGLSAPSELGRSSVRLPAILVPGKESYSPSPDRKSVVKGASVGRT